MESKTNYTIVGLMVLVLSFGLLTTGLWLSIGFDQKKYNKFIVYMRESVSGLGEESIIRYNGVKVGYVSKIELSKSDPEQVKVILKIEEGIPITTSTQATLITQGITGTTYLGLSATSAIDTPLQKTPGEIYPVIPYKPSFFNQLEKNVNDLSVSLKHILNKENAEHIKKSLANVQTLTDVFAQNQREINQMLQELPVLTHELHDTIGQFKSMAHDVAAAGKQVSAAMRAGHNTIDKISQQAVPPAVLLLRRLDLIAANMEKMSAEMRQNPAIIIRGSAPPKPGPGERA